ncbi:MAG: hypothetical protein AAFX03_10795 [Pseudomonadota bacterium]
MRVIAAALALAALSACGFQPAYAPSSVSGNGAIAIDQIDGRAGHSLRKALIRELGPGLPGVQNARLNVQLDERLRRVALQPDGAASRTDFQAYSSYVLDTGETAIQGDVLVETSFNVPFAPFADVSAQVDAADRAMDILARRIVDDIRLQLADLDS